MNHVIPSLAALVAATCVSNTVAQSSCGGTPGYHLLAPATVANGEIATFNFVAPAGQFVVLFASSSAGQVATPYGTLCVTLPSFALPLGPMASSGSFIVSQDFCATPLVGTALNLQFLAVNASQPAIGGVSNAINVSFVPGTCQTGADPNAVGLVVLDKSMMSPGYSTIEAAASAANVASDTLINANNPTLGVNPPLQWNLLYSGGEVVLPGGEVGNEGLFALPAVTPWNAFDYATGTIPQPLLDKIPNVMPLRNQQLQQMIGRKFVGVLHGSDVGINFSPLESNLQGDRYGRFSFTVLGLVVAGSIDESLSSTSLYDLRVRVEAPLSPSYVVNAPIQSVEPDTIQLNISEYNEFTQTLTVTGISSQPSLVSEMTLSVDGFLLEAPMTFNTITGEFQFSIKTSQNLNGRRVTMSSSRGGVYNYTLQ